MTFTELGAHPELEKALAIEGITEPTPVQIQSAKVLMEGKDAFISSETGTGKTLAYLLPILSRVDQELAKIQTIIITPTHELAVQVQNQLQKLIQHSELPIRSQLLIGGSPIKRQIEKLKKKPQVVVGSPGRVLELIQMRKLKVHTVKSIVIDEIDRLLMGETVESIREIVKSTLKERQLIFVSATEQKECVSEAASLSSGLIIVNAKSGRINPNIKHLYFVEEERKKIDLLRRLFSAMTPERAIVFVHRNERVDVLTRKLEHHKLKIAHIHKDCTKLERKKALDDFRSGHSTVLISSDISSRGLDIKDVSHIFNLDVPSKSEDYVHRVGRTGRAGKEGCAVTLATQQQVDIVQKHAQSLNIQITEGMLMNGKVVEENIV
ncbi:DEAD/DEAH box helicase [bacterium]|nr:DEAD/DEAH box helicase [bacterium]